MSTLSLVLALAAATPTPPPAPAPKEGEITTARYITGGCIGTGVGFGIGHAIQRRTASGGGVITALEIGGLVFSFFGLFSLHAPEESKRQTAKVLVYGGLGTYVGTRIYEIVDVWTGPKHHGKFWRVGLGPGSVNVALDL
jgi:hypothetical protein